MQIVKPGIILFIVTFVAAAVLGFVNMVTSPIIAENNQKAKNAAMAELLPEAKDNNFSDDIPVTVEDSSVVMYNVGYDGTTEVGYIVTVVPKGYGGTIKLLVALTTDNTVKGVTITEHSETPGLGANANKPSFLEQYTGKSEQLTVVKTPPMENEIEAITSATITTRAITDGVNDAIEFVKNKEAGGASD